MHVDTLLPCSGASVLVAAHTSAGKTVIAQYACAMGLRYSVSCLCRAILCSLQSLILQHPPK